MMDTLSNPSPVGSEIFALIALLVVSLVVLLILRYFLPLRTTPAYLLVPVFFALWLPAGTILLVPVDLASSARTDDVATRGIWLPQRMLLVSWRITYWLTFALTWSVASPNRSTTGFWLTLSASPPGLSCRSSPSTPTPATASRKTASCTRCAKTPSTRPSCSAPAFSGWSTSSSPTASRSCR